MIMSFAAGGSDRPSEDADTRPSSLEALRLALDRERQAHERIRESEAGFRQLAEILPDIFWISDPIKQQLLYVSPAYEKLWGRTCESLQANPKSWYDAIHPEDRGRVFAAAATKQADGAYDETFRVIQPDQSIRWIRDRARPVRDDAGTVYRIVGTAHDITEQIKTDEVIGKVRTTEAIGSVAARLGHDFNNIFATINGYIELARLRSKDDVRTAEYLEAATLASERASAIVRQILTFDQPADQMARGFLDPATVVAEPLRLLRASTPPAIEFVENLPRGLPLVRSDPSQFRQIVMNLCANALEAMQGMAGRLEVGLQGIRFPTDSMVGGRQLPAGQYIQLTVSDTGPGIDPISAERIFDPFVIAHSQNESMGLGLAIVNVIVHRLGGAVRLDSQLGKGASFQVVLPAYVVGKVADPVDHTLPIKGRGERILVVDDTTTLTHPGLEVLVGLGYRAQALTSPQRALETIQADPRAFDLVMSSLTLPGMSGYEFARAVRKIRADLPIVLTTDYFVGFELELASASGVREVLRQPQDARKLSEAVHHALTAEGVSRLCHTSS